MPARRAGLERRPTERVHPLADRLEALPVRAFLAAMHAEDAKALHAVRRALPALARVGEAAADSLRRGGRLLYVGAGTSGRLAALDAAECPPTFGIAHVRVVAVVAGGRRALWRAVEGAEDDAVAGARALRRLGPGSDDLVLGLTASGDTPFVVGALRAARRGGARTALIVSAATPARALADLLVVLDTGPELLQGSTRLKAGTALKLALNMISTYALATSGHVLRGRMVRLRPTSEKLRRRAARVVADLTGLPSRRAAALVTRAGSVELALVMAARHTDRAGALRALRRAGGDLARALGENFLAGPARR